VSMTASSSRTGRSRINRTTSWLRPAEALRDAGTLLALCAIARLATLDEAEASRDLLNHFDTSAWAVSILLILADLLLPVRQASVITRRDLWHRAVNPNRNSRASSLTVCLVTC